MRFLIWLGGGVVIVASLVIVGQRFGDQAMAVLVGAVCGVMASVPTSLLIIRLT